MTIQTALRQSVSLLEDAAIPEPRLTAEVLLSHALRKERIFLYSHGEDELSENAWIHLGRYLHQRLKGIPTQYITKRQEFYGRPFRVTPAVLIPRPETELVVEHALRLIRPGSRIVDVGCGSGAIATTIALETSASVYATDISGEALQVARTNAQNLRSTVALVQADLLAPFVASSVDVIVSNPPYVAFSEANGLQREVREFEPHVALFAGTRGTEIYERIIREAAQVLRPGGHLVFELGWRSLEPVQGMLEGAWKEHTVTDDLAGIPRVLSARWSP